MEDIHPLPARPLDPRRDARVDADASPIDARFDPPDDALFDLYDVPADPFAPADPPRDPPRASSGDPAASGSPIAGLIAELAEMPRERLWRCGTQAIGDAELIALVLGTGVRDRPALAVAGDLVREVGGVAALSRASPTELSQVHGVGAARAARIAAAFELGRRAVEVVHHRRRVGRAEDIFRCIAPRLAGLTQEVFFSIGVDVRNGLLDIVEVARGSLVHVEVHPREVFRPLIRMAAAGGVLAHNHPSGDATPSGADGVLTRRMREVGRLIGIPIIDHVVIGDRSFRSIAEWMGPDF